MQFVNKNYFIDLQVHGLLRSQKTFPSCDVVKRGYSGIVVVDKPTLAIQQLCRARVTGRYTIPNHYCYCCQITEALSTMLSVGAL